MNQRHDTDAAQNRGRHGKHRRVLARIRDGLPHHLRRRDQAEDEKEARRVAERRRRGEDDDHEKDETTFITDVVDTNVARERERTRALVASNDIGESQVRRGGRKKKCVSPQAC